jgi:hypothetical protein
LFQSDPVDDDGDEAEEEDQKSKTQKPKPKRASRKSKKSSATVPVSGKPTQPTEVTGASGTSTEPPLVAKSNQPTEVTGASGTSTKPPLVAKSNQPTEVTGASGTSTEPPLVAKSNQPTEVTGASGTSTNPSLVAKFNQPTEVTGASGTPTSTIPQPMSPPTSVSSPAHPSLDINMVGLSKMVNSITVSTADFMDVDYDEGTRPETPTGSNKGSDQISNRNPPTVIGKHLRLPNSTPSSPSRDRTKRPKATPLNFESDEGDDEDQLIGGSRPRKPSALTQPHRPYPQQKGEKSAFDPSNTPLGQLFSQGNATANSLPALKRKKDPKEKGKARF